MGAGCAKGGHLPLEPEEISTCGTAAKRSAGSRGSSGRDAAKRGVGRDAAKASAGRNATTNADGDKPKQPPRPPGSTRPPRRDERASLVSAADAGEYDLVSSYMDDLIGVSDSERPEGWCRKSNDEIARDSAQALRESDIQMIYADGRRAPPPKRERTEEQRSGYHSDDKINDEDPAARCVRPVPASQAFADIVAGWNSIDNLGNTNPAADASTMKHQYIVPKDSTLAPSQTATRHPPVSKAFPPTPPQAKHRLEERNALGPTPAPKRRAAPHGGSSKAAS